MKIRLLLRPNHQRLIEALKKLMGIKTVIQFITKKHKMFSVSFPNFFVIKKNKIMLKKELKLSKSLIKLYISQALN